MPNWWPARSWGCFRQPLATLLMAVATALFIAALGLLIGALAKGDDQAVIFSLIPMFVFAGLGGACTIQTAKLLQEAVEDKAQPHEVTIAAKMHLARVRKSLFGNTEKEG